MSVEQERLSGDGWAPPWVRHEHRARYLFARDLVEGRTVVDCACGDGTSSRLLAERATAVWAFDLADDAVAYAAHENAAPNVTYAQGDATGLPLAPDIATAYVSLETIEHLPDDRAFLQEVVRVLAADGVFVCSTPDREVYSPGNGPGDTPWNQFHLREYARDEFVNLLEEHFEHVELYGQNRKSRGVTALKHRLGSRLPARAMVRVNQFTKLPRLLYDRLERHAVVPASPRARYEYLVAVCRGPRVTAQPRA